MSDHIGDELAGEVLTERQALVYLLRGILKFDRQAVAEELESSPSNVDNIHRRARTKIEDAKRVSERLRSLRGEVQ